LTKGFGSDKICVSAIIVKNTVFRIGESFKKISSSLYTQRHIKPLRSSMRRSLIKCLQLFSIVVLFLMLFTPVDALNDRIDYGIAKTGSITSPGSVDTYSFSGENGDAIVIRIAKTGGEIFPRITLYGPSGAELKRVHSSSTSEIKYILTTSGTHKILVDDGFLGKYTGDYSLFIQRINNPANVKSFELGTAKSGSIGQPGIIDTYALSCSSDDAINIRIAKIDGELFPRITLYGPSGTELKRAHSSSTSEILYTAASPGTYTILVDDGFLGKYTGEYSLFIQLTSGQEGGSVAVSAPTVTDTRITTHPTTVGGTMNTETPGSDSLVNYLVWGVIACIGLGVVVIAGKRFSGKSKVSTPATLNSGIQTHATLGSRMPGTIDHDVIISYSTIDKPIADAVCAGLESRGIRCWIAPRDILAGMNYQEGIIDAINSSKIMVLIYSSHANESPHVIREATIAMSKKVIIVPFRVEDAPPSKSMEFIISIPHWLDAITPPLERHIEELGSTIQVLLGN